MKKNKIEEVVTTFVIILLTYLFLSLCNWSFSPVEWNGISRFFLGLVGVIGILNLS